MAEKIVTGKDVEVEASFYCEHEPLTFENGEVLSFVFTGRLFKDDAPKIRLRFCKKCGLVYWEYEEEENG